jgi:hypothetical protein
MTIMLLGVLLATPVAPQSQAPRTVSSQDLRIAQGARAIMDAPGKWNHADTGTCPADATTFSIYCALEKASKDLTGTFDDGGPAPREGRQLVDFMAGRKDSARLIDYNNDPATSFADIQAFFRTLENRLIRQLELSSPTASPPLAKSSCQFLRSKDRWEGSCGPMFGTAPFFSMAPAAAISTGVWQREAQPAAVWSGSITNVSRSDAPVEMEIYSGGTGVLRTEWGWFPVSVFESGASELRFTVDAEHEVAPNALDREVVQRAATILTSDAVWNRADNRECAPSATTWSIYCAIERASRDVAGGFHHRRPALELVRKIVDERTQDRSYDHRLMDYNNDPSTHLADVRNLFAEAVARIK